LSGIYIPRQREIARLEELLSESRAGLSRLKQGEDDTERRRRVNELTKKISRFKAISRHLRSGTTFVDYPLGADVEPSRAMG
jgi:hypothetical protein